ncbi:hypothetical protein [Clostridium sp.]|uniref:hypothetical protein n=1 Tax=Clostridium sp. TaxID=1506 RepID=UPI0034643C05
MVILYFQNVVSIDTVILFSGLIQVFLGLNLINLSKSIDSKKITTTNKILGICFIVLGLIITIDVLTKMII